MTVGATSIPVSRVIEHALRRCDVPVEKQTADTVQVAKDNLFFLLSHYGSRGLPLWCVEEKFIPIEAGKFKYELPIGTYDLLSANLRTYSSITSTDTVAATNVVSNLGESYSPTMLAVTCDVSTELTLKIEYSTDGVSYSQAGEILSVSATANEPYWLMLNFSQSAQYFRITEQTLADANFSAVQWVSTYTDRVLNRMNRDQYFMLPNRHSSGTPAQYWYDRQNNPEVSLWPVPTESSLIQIVRQRYISDVTSLTGNLDIPDRWIEATIWQLAKRLALSLPGIDPGRLQIVIQMAAENIIEIEAEDVDNSPMYLQPDIGVYTQ